MGDINVLLSFKHEIGAAYENNEIHATHQCCTNISFFQHFFNIFSSLSL